jgi:predicted DNA-binding transcriptional regulator YafY
MKKYHGKTDRTARLLKLQMLFAQNPHGLELEKIANQCSVSFRTIYRDLKTLEYELDIPLWFNKGKYGIAEGHFLPPISFTREEAMNIFMAIRLMQNLSYSSNPSITSTFAKLNTIVPLPVRQKIQNTLENMNKQPADERKRNVFNKLSQAWLSQNVVKIKYMDKYSKDPVDYHINIYFIEPSIHGHSNYVIAYCEEMNQVFPFKMDRVIADVTVSSKTYEIPTDFSIVENLGSEWDVNVNQKLETVKLHFNSKISFSAMVTIWHPSQTVEALEDGSIIMTFRVRDITYFRAWVLGWGNDVEVLEPEELRTQIRDIVSSLKDIYCEGK